MVSASCGSSNENRGSWRAGVRSEEDVAKAEQRSGRPEGWENRRRLGEWVTPNKKKAARVKNMKTR